MAKERKITFVPSICRGEEAEYEGMIVLKSLSHYDKIEMAKTLGVGVKSEGGVEIAEGSSQLDLALKLVKFSEGYYLPFELTHKKTQEKWTEFEDLLYDPRMTPVLNEVALFLMNGDQLGKV